MANISMSHIDHDCCLRLTVSVSKDRESEMIQDMPNLKSRVDSFETDQDAFEASEPESFSFLSMLLNKLSSISKLMLCFISQIVSHCMPVQPVKTCTADCTRFVLLTKAW